MSFFEGSEKKVELVFDRRLPTLRGWGDDRFREIVAAAGARILSKISNRKQDAYLLSESSLFVFDHKLVLITCGLTTLQDAVAEILREADPSALQFLVYQRKNEVFPHEQATSFFDDLAALRRIVPGTAYQFGETDAHHMRLFHLDREEASAEPDDRTIEVLMYGIDRRYRDRPGLEALLPRFQVDEHDFDPTGYSLNAIRDEEYYTLHVTPNPGCSYASFETNGRFPGPFSEILEALLARFEPRSFDLIVFDQERSIRCDDVPGYLPMQNRFAGTIAGGYQVTFESYRRRQSGSREPREIATIDPPAKTTAS